MATGLPFAPNVATTSGSSTTTQVKPSQGYQEGIDRGQRAYDEQEQAMTAQNALQVKQAKHTAALYQGQAARDEQYQQERQRIRAEQQQQIQQAHQRYDQTYQAAVAAQGDQSSWWDHKTSEQKTGARLAIFLGAIGSGMAGTDNKALAYIQGQVKDEADRKAKRGDALMKLAEHSKGALSDAYRERAEELSDVDLNYAAGLKVVANQADAYAKTMLPKELQAQGAEKVAVLHKEAAKYYQDAHEKFNTKIESQSGHTVTTEGLGKGNGGDSPGRAAQHMQTMALYGDSMKSAIETMEKLPEPSESDLKTIQDNQGALNAVGEEQKTLLGAAKVKAGRWLGMVPRNIHEGVDPKAQLYVNAMTRANEAYSRVLAGQGMPEPAQRRLEQQMSLQPNDSKEVRAYKVAAMKRERDNFMSLSGQFGTQVGPGAAEENIAENEANVKDARMISAGKKAQMGLSAHKQTGAPGSASRSLAPAAPSVAELIAKGRALKAAGDVVGARRIHDQLSKQLGGQ
jgi:hypothetical protein